MEDLFQGRDVHGFGEMKIEAGGAAASAIVFAAPAGQGDEQGARERRLATKVLGNFVTGHSRQPDVEEDDVGQKCLRGG